MGSVAKVRSIGRNGHYCSTTWASSGGGEQRPRDAGGGALRTFHVEAVRKADDGTCPDLAGVRPGPTAADAGHPHALQVHENTIRYRLGRIRDLSFDPTSLDSLLSARPRLPGPRTRRRVGPRRNSFLQGPRSGGSEIWSPAR